MRDVLLMHTTDGHGLAKELVKSLGIKHTEALEGPHLDFVVYGPQVLSASVTRLMLRAPEISRQGWRWLCREPVRMYSTGWVDVGRCGITLPGSPRRMVVAEKRAGTNRRADEIFVLMIKIIIKVFITDFHQIFSRTVRVYVFKNVTPWPGSANKYHDHF